MEDLPGFNSQRQRTALRLRLPEKLPSRTKKAQVQESLVDYLREKNGDGPADLCRDVWTCDRGRMCLAHACYAGSNNNMDVEVSWRLIKDICSELVCLTQFISALCKFIRRQLGE